MNPQIQQKLKAIIVEHSTSIVNDPRRIKAMLKDLFPQNKREVRVLSTVLDEGFAKRLLRDGDKIPTSISIPQYAQILHDDLAIDLAMSRWAVETWAMALSLEMPQAATPAPTLPPTQTPTPKPTPKPTVMPTPAPTPQPTQTPTPTTPVNKKPWLLIAGVVSTIAVGGVWYQQEQEKQREETARLTALAEQKEQELNAIKAEQVAREQAEAARLAREKAETERYRDNKDGTITDSQTGLQWKRCSEGQNWTGSTCSGKAKIYNWNDATRLTSNFAGKSDWRLPSIKELSTLVYCSNGKVLKFAKYGYKTVWNEGYYGCSSNTRVEYQKPTINTQAFPATPASFFWSSSSKDINSYSAWGVYFDSGYEYNSVSSNYDHARLVRGGQ